MLLDQSEINVFDVYFAGVVSMAHCHPGAGIHKAGNVYTYAPFGYQHGAENAPKRLSIEECAKVALEMIAVRRKVLEQA